MVYLSEFLILICIFNHPPPVSGRTRWRKSGVVPKTGMLEQFTDGSMTKITHTQKHSYFGQINGKLNLYIQPSAIINVFFFLNSPKSNLY